MGLEGSYEYYMNFMFCLFIFYLCGFGKLYMFLSLNYLIFKGFLNLEVIL